jgi:circadian clock protein KaiC
VQTAVERDGASAVIVDSLNGYLHAMAEERFLNVHLHELAAYLDQKAVNAYLVAAQHGLFSPSTDQALDISYIADSVLLLRNFEYHGEIRKAISIYKRRAGGHETSIRELTLNKDGIHISRPLTQFQGVLTGEPQFVQSANGGGDG